MNKSDARLNTFSPSISSSPGQSAYTSRLPVKTRFMFNERAATCSSGAGEVNWIEKGEGSAKEGEVETSKRRRRSGMADEGSNALALTLKHHLFCN